MSSQIHDLGYRPYEGERAGVPWAVRSLAVHSMRRALGLKRAARHKIAPVLAIGIAFIPAVAMAGIALFIGGDLAEELIGFADYFGLTWFAIILFLAAVAPGVITTDRTSGMLALYLASPLNRTTYLFARTVGIFIVLLAVSFGPILFLILAYALADSGPDGVVGFVELVGRALLASLLVAAVLSALGVFLSSIPRRWGLASLLIVGTVFISESIAAFLTEQTDVTNWVAFLGLISVLAEAWGIVLGDRSFISEALASHSGAVVILVVMGYAAALLAAAWWRYQRIEVER